MTLNLTFIVQIFNLALTIKVVEVLLLRPLLAKITTEEQQQHQVQQQIVAAENKLQKLQTKLDGLQKRFIADTGFLEVVTLRNQVKLDLQEVYGVQVKAVDLKTVPCTSAQLKGLANNLISTGNV